MAEKLKTAPDKAKKAQKPQVKAEKAVKTPAKAQAPKAEKAPKVRKGITPEQRAKAKATVTNGLIFQNPILVLFLGMCATLAVSTSLTNGLGMGLSTTAVLVCSNVVISLLRKFIPKEVRIACYVVIIAGFVTVVDLMMQAFLPSLSASLGIFIPLIVVNCIILGRAEAFASKQTVGFAALDGISMGLGFTLVLSVMGFIRELLGNGSILGNPVLPEKAILIAAPCGGFFVLGFLVALTQYLRGRDWSKFKARFGGKKAKGGEAA